MCGVPERQRRRAGVAPQPQLVHERCRVAAGRLLWRGRGRAQPPYNLRPPQCSLRLHRTWTLIFQDKRSIKSLEGGASPRFAGSC